MLILSFAALTLFACGKSSGFVDSGLEDSGSDAGVDAPMVDANNSMMCGGEVCEGSCCTTCDGTPYCTMGGCLTVECPPNCEAQEAAGVGDCDAIVGVAWNGASCVTISGCSCEGADCSQLHESIEQCEMTQARCGQTSMCSAWEATGTGDCPGFFGYTWNGTSCAGISGCDCVGRDCGRLFDSQETCEASQQECLQQDCRPQDARGEGACRASVGIFWDGVECQEKWGCSCAGADCSRAFDSVEQCQAAHRTCEPQGCNRNEECAPHAYCTGGLCRTSPCAGDGSELNCFSLRPDCSEGEVSVVQQGCWVCVSEMTCE